MQLGELNAEDIIVITGIITIRKGGKHDFLSFLLVPLMKTEGCKWDQIKFFV